MPTLHLRRLTIFVDEPDPGCFYWVMIESKEDAAIWEDLRSSEESYPTWHEAHLAGTIELMKLVPDHCIGPRAPGEDENASPVG